MKKTVKNPKQAYEFYNEGLIKAKQERYSESIQALNEAIRIDRYYVNAYNILGKVYLHTGEIQKAQECWLTTLSIDELNPTAIACLNALNQESFLTKLKNSLPAVFLFFTLATFLVLILRIDGDIRELRLKLVDMNERLMVSEIKSPPEVARNEVERRKVNRLRSEGKERGEAFSPPYTSDPPGFSQQQQQNESVDVKPEIQSPVHEDLPPLTVPPPPLAEEQIEETYNQARAHFESEKYDIAIAEFQKILDSNSDSHLMDNAQYWLADCYYHKGEYGLSAKSFEKVKDFPDGNKVEDANRKIEMLKTLQR